MSAQGERFASNWHCQVPPEGKSLEQCQSHGDDHASYGWAPKIDSRWSAEQKAAYWTGYDNAKKEKEKIK